VWFAATLSSSGGSAELVRRLYHHHVQIVISSHVLTEVTRNLQKKGEATALQAFFDLFALVHPTVVDPTPRAVEHAAKVINKKDARILAAAKAAHCDVLVTLDRRHLFKSEVTRFAKPMSIVLPEHLLR
jgi:predicted nucleic acid-binding protein